MRLDHFVSGFLSVFSSGQSMVNPNSPNQVAAAKFEAVKELDAYTANIVRTEPYHEKLDLPSVTPLDKNSFNSNILFKDTFQSFRQFCYCLMGDDYEFFPPPTAPSTPSRVLIGLHKTDIRKNCVVKLFFNRDACEREIKANQMLQKRLKNTAINLANPILSQGEVRFKGVPCPYLIMEKIQGSDLEYLLQRPSQSSILATSKAGDILGQLHKHTLSEFSDPKAQVLTLEAENYQQYHVDYVIRLIEPNGVLDAFCDAGWLSAFFAERMKLEIEKIIHVFNEERRSFDRFSLVHGDYHPGNIIFHEMDTAAAIDWETLAWSASSAVDDVVGIARPEEDYYRFVATLRVNQIRFGLPENLANFLSFVFKNAYEKQAPIAIVKTDQRLHFYEVRAYAAFFEMLVNCWRKGCDTNTLKISEAATRKVLVWFSNTLLT